MVSSVVDQIYRRIAHIDSRDSRALYGLLPDILRMDTLLRRQLDSRPVRGVSHGMHELSHNVPSISYISRQSEQVMKHDTYMWMPERISFRCAIHGGEYIAPIDLLSAIRALHATINSISVSYLGHCDDINQPVVSHRHRERHVVTKHPQFLVEKGVMFTNRPT